MVDQVAFKVFDTPASGDPALFDVTHPDITEPFSCALFFYSASLSDGTDEPHGSIGSGFCTANPDSAVSGAASSMQIEHDVTASDNGQTFSTAQCIRVQAGTAVATNVIAGAFSAAIAGGVRLNFTNRTGRTRVLAVLFAGLAQSCVNLISAGTSGVGAPCAAQGGGTFEPHNLVLLAGDTTGGSLDESEAQPNLGLAVNDGASAQVCSFFNVDEISPTDSDGAARTANAFGKVALTGRTEQLGTVTFTGTGFNHQANVGGLRAAYLAMRFTGSMRLLCAQLAVSGSAGDQDFALGHTPLLVLGMSTLLAATNTLTDGPTASAWGFFVTGMLGSRAYTAHNQEGLTLNPAKTKAHTRQENVAVLTYDHLGAIAQRATWVGGISGGFRLNFSVATAGTMTVLAIGSVIVPSPVALPLVIPTPLRAIAGVQTPSPVLLPLVVPSVQRLVAKTPSPVVLALVLGTPQVFTPFVPTPTDVVDLGPLYAEALSSLLPRGLAWARRPLP